MNKQKKNKLRVKSDLSKKLKSVVKGKKVGVYIDAANLYYAATSVGMYVSFESVSEWFKKNSNGVDLNFYTAYDESDEKQIHFIDDLAQYGYRIVKKPVKVFDNLRKGNMDIELAVDALTRLEKYDIFILISGDGDFNYLLQTLEKEGKQTAILSIGGFTSYELHQEAGNYFFLDRIASVWKAKSTTAVQKQKYYVFIDQIEQNDYNPDYEYKMDEITLPGKKEVGSNKQKNASENKNARKTIVKKQKQETEKPTETKKLKVKLKLNNKKKPKIFAD